MKYTFASLFYLFTDEKHLLCLLPQSRGTTVPAAPPQPKTKAPREEDFENIKLISNGAYGYEGVSGLCTCRERF